MIMFLIVINLVLNKLCAENVLNGKVFFNYSNDLSEGGTNAFNIKRSYLTLANDIDENVSYKITYDMGSNDGGSAYTAFLKVAMVKLKTKMGYISIGMQGMNMFKTMENTWGHRFISKMPMDEYKFSASADLGIGLTRSFGLISTSALITNGGGYKTSEIDQFKKLSIHGVYGETKLNKQDGFNSGLSFSMEPQDNDSLSTIENTYVIGVFTGYAVNGFRGGFEYDLQSRTDNFSNLISTYVTYRFSDKFSFLGRLDQVDISKNNDEFKAIILGLHYKAVKGLNIAPLFRIKSYEKENSESSIILNFQFKF